MVNIKVGATIYKKNVNRHLPYIITRIQNQNGRLTIWYRLRDYFGPCRTAQEYYCADLDWFVKTFGDVNYK